MLWAADVNGRLAGLTRPWFAPGAESCIAEAQPDIMAAVRTVLRSVFPSRMPASTHHRVSCVSKRPFGIQVDASPALSPETGTFVGYLGSIRPVAGDVALPSTSEAGSRVAHIVLLDAMAEHVIAARKLAVQGNERQLARMLDMALLSIGDQMAGRQP